MLCKSLCYFLVFIKLLTLSATQDDSIQSPVSTYVCDTCSCVDGQVDCSNKDINRPFTIAEWDGLQTKNITEINLYGNPLKSITPISSAQIQTLNLSNCALQTIEDFSFQYLVDLKTLDLSYNKLETRVITRSTFLGLPSANGPPLIFRKMRYLNLSYNDIHSLLQDIFYFMPNIKILDLSGNPLGYIDQVTMAAITELINLNELRLSSCQLESLPEGIFRRQRRLEILDISDNRFTTIPAVLAETSNLKFLNFDRNPLDNITEKSAITSMKKLETLRLCRMSKLTSIGPEGLGGLESLKILYLSQNPRLRSLDPAFLRWDDEDDVENWPLLQELYLNNNNISEINSHYLHRWDQLTVVDVSNNPFSCDCTNQWMLDVLLPLIVSTVNNATVQNMICKSPPELRGLSFPQLRDSSRVLTCTVSEDISILPTADMAVVLGITIGIFVTFPMVLVLVLLWKKGIFAKCRKKMKYDYDDEEMENL